MFGILFHFRKHVWLCPCGIYSQVTCLSRAVHNAVVICSYKLLFERSVTKYIFNKNGGEKNPTSLTTSNMRIGTWRIHSCLLLS